MTAVYNEFDKNAAQWLRNLNTAGHIAAGDVLDQSIRDIQPRDIDGYAQAHFFAGIGVWSYALRLAGWPDDRPVWTGSCPCQPFSAAGKRGGLSDDRHLWPEWFRLIEQCRPPVIFGEQVASPDGLKWFDIVSSDLENAGYSVGAADLCAAGVGAPHIRQRLYFVAVAGEQRRQGFGVHVQPGKSRSAGAQTAGGGAADQLAHPNDAGLQGRASGRDRPHQQSTGADGVAVLVGDASSSSRGGRDTRAVSGAQGQSPEQGFGARRFPNELVPAGTTRGAWADADWWNCRDGKIRPAEPGTFPLADGSAGRVGRLRAYGNAIVAQTAAEFIGAFLDYERSGS